MLYEFTGVCQHCAAVVSVIVHNSRPLKNCPECKEPPFALRQFKGSVYVVSNSNQTGVKIGITTKTVEQRIKSLNSTGVAGAFEPIVIFPSDRPKADEKKIHDKLAKKKISKEHFSLSPVDAALKCYRVLNRREPIFFDKEIEDTFRLRLEEDRIKMKLRLKGKGNFKS